MSRRTVTKMNPVAARRPPDLAGPDDLFRERFTGDRLSFVKHVFQFGGPTPAVER